MLTTNRIGADAVEGFAPSTQSLEEELSRWEDVARATAFDA
jgi:hypothetical protein